MVSIPNANGTSPFAPAGNGIVQQEGVGVGVLCQDLPSFVQVPPIETVTFGWGVNEDGQLVRQRAVHLFDLRALIKAGLGPVLLLLQVSAAVSFLCCTGRCADVM